jgi:hypothetical protein
VPSNTDGTIPDAIARRVWLHHDQGAAPVPPGFGEQDPEEPITCAKPRPGGAGQGGQLLSKRQILERYVTVAAADQSDESKKYDQRREHV